MIEFGVPPKALTAIVLPLKYAGKSRSFGSWPLAAQK